MCADPADGDSLRQLDELVLAAKKDAEEATRRPDPLQAIAFFDLTGSTSAKLARGNVAASQDAIAFTRLAKAISARVGGRVVKTLGDGALVTFPDPIAACRAALNLRYATYERLQLEMTAGITVGRPLRVPLGNKQFDVLGDVVDRAARIQSLASPGQVLIDGTLYNQVRADIASEPGWQIEDTPRRAWAKGIGDLELYEVCLRGHWTLKKQLATPFRIIESGRPSVAEKIALIQNAQSEIVEIGIGLTSFAQYFSGQRPDEFRDPIRSLVRGGVQLKCFTLDPDYGPGKAWLAEQDDTQYEARAQLAKEYMEKEARFYRDGHYLGKLSIHTYTRIPEFWCLGVDVEDPVDGRMFFAPYLMGVSRSEMSVIQVSRVSNPKLYGLYLESVRTLRAASNEPTHR